jgi:hypothetical protein
VAVALTRAHTHPHTYPRAHAPAHAHTFAWEGKSPTLCLYVPRPSQARWHSAAASQGAALRGAFPPGWCEHRVVLELAHSFSCMLAWPLADASHPSHAAEPLCVCPPWTPRTHACSLPVPALVLLSTRTHPRTP